MARLRTLFKRTRRRRLSVALAVVITGVFVLELLHVVYVRGQLQVVTDALATADARVLNHSDNRGFRHSKDQDEHLRSTAIPVSLTKKNVEVGFWDRSSRRFIASGDDPNAVRVTARSDAESLLLGRLFGVSTYDVEVSAVAIAKPRDIVFVVDLSSAMHDDSARAIDVDMFEPDSHQSNITARNLYHDLAWTDFPGPLLAISPADLSIICDDSQASPSDRRAALASVIDHQIAKAMPDAKPTADSSTNYRYWADYVRFLLDHGDSEKPARKIGYRTYLQFMLAHGRDLKPGGTQYAPFSIHHLEQGFHEEVVGNQRFQFPPRCQPMHDVRRGLIAALQSIQQMNTSIGRGTTRDNDRVAIITFDRLIGGGPRIAAPLTDDYAATMVACSQMQAVGDRGHSSAAEAGLAQAQDLLKAQSQGGSRSARREKMIVFISGSTPNLYRSRSDELRRRMHEMPNRSYYPDDKPWLNAPLTLAAEIHADPLGISLYAVGVGSGADLDFLRRLNSTVSAPSQPALPTVASDENHLVEILDRIFSSSPTKIVQ